MLKLRSATPEDLLAVVRVHQAAFEGFFMTRLGPRFLCHYYETVIAYPRGLLIVAEDTQRHVVGFVAGFCSPAMFYRTLRNRSWLLTRSLIPGILRAPRMLMRILTNFLLVEQRMQAELDQDWCELCSIGVAPEAAGMGVGKALTRAFCVRAGDMGARLVYLTTDAFENKGANRFYQNMGFHLAETFNAGRGRVMNKYVLSVGVGENRRQMEGN